MTHTHEGWFWFCPILASFDSDDQITVEARWSWLEWLFSVAEAFEATRIALSMAMIPDYEPSFVFKLKPIRAVIDA